MKKIYFTVGPSQTYPSVFKHIKNGLKNDILSLSHTGEEFVNLYKRTSDNLRRLLDIPGTHYIFFTGSSTESMERILANTVQSNSVHLINGGFAQKFFKTALDLNKQPIPIELPLDKEFNLLKLRIPKGTELLCITQNETSTGMCIPMKIISSIKKNYPKLLIAADIVSAVPHIKVNFNIIDLAFFSVQKGFGLPAGLGILIVNKKALKKAELLRKKGISIGGHHNFISLAEKEQVFKTPATPNVFYIYLLEKVTGDMLAKGIKKIRLETEQKAKMIYDFFEKQGKYKPIVYKSYLSMTTLVFDVQGKAERIRDKLLKKGISISKGYGVNAEQHIRIGNFPSITKENVEKLLVAMHESLN